MNGARVSVNPRYNVADGQADVVINWANDDTNVELTASADNQEVVVNHSMDKTSIKLTASADNQEVTISQQVDDNNRVSPTVSRNGDISVEWERTLSDDSSLTATLRPNDSLDVEWKDADWTANVNMPIDGANISGANVSIKRDVSF
jgi:SH3-like domain-containing protein